jgi:hypothetical protein
MLWKTTADIGDDRSSFLFPGERGHYNTDVSGRKEMRVTTAKSRPLNDFGVTSALPHCG